MDEGFALTVIVLVVAAALAVQYWIMKAAVTNGVLAANKQQQIRERNEALARQHQR